LASPSILAPTLFIAYSVTSAVSSMSPVAAAPKPTTTLAPSPFAPELRALATAPSNVEAKAVADSIALSLKKAPRNLDAIQDGAIIDVVLAWSSSTSGFERESGPVLVERICRSLGTGVEGVFLPLVPALLTLAMDKGQPVRSAVNTVMNSLIKICPAEASRMVFDTLCRTLDEAKGWRTKVAALKAMEGLVKPGAEEWVAMELGRIIPVIEHAMHDTKSEVSLEGSSFEVSRCGG